MSDSSSDLSKATTASTSTFVTALAFNILIFGVEIIAFTIIRPYFPAIYQPRSYIPPEEKRSPPITTKLSWPLFVYRADFRRIKDVNGLDAYFFVRFLRMVARILLPMWIASWLVLLPVNAVGTSVVGRTGLDKLSFGNVSPDKQTRYVAHLILAYLFTFWIGWNIKREMKHFIIARQQWLIDPTYAMSPQASTVLIRGITQRYLTEAALTQLFSCLPGGVAKVWLNRNLKEMPDLYSRRMEACAKLESAETSLLSTATKLRNKRLQAEATAQKGGGAEKSQSQEFQTSDARPLTEQSMPGIDVDTERNVSLAEALVPEKKRPTHRLPLFSWLPFSIPLVGKKVNSIEWARQEIIETSAALKECRRTLARDVRNSSVLQSPETGHPSSLKPDLSSQTYPPYSSAFVLFHRQIAAHLATQILAHHAPYRMADRHLSVDPEDVIWGNLNLNPYEARARNAISWGITLGLIILWAIPVAFVGALSNIHALCKWAAWICDLPDPIIGIISGILPPVALALLMILLPIVLRQLSRFEGTPTKTGVELSLMTRFFVFQVINSFLVVTLSSGIIASLPSLVKDISSAPTLLAQNLPKASNFFLTYVVLQGLSGTASGFLQVVSLVLYYVQLAILGGTPRSIYDTKYKLRSAPWGTLFPATTLLVVITIAYSIISPVINGLSCFAFFLFYQLWKYLFLWQLDQPRSSDTGGLFFPKAIQHVFVGLYIQQICLAALFFFAQNEQRASALPEGGLMIVLIVFTGFFQTIISNSYGPLLKALPLSLADKTRGMGEDENRDEAERDLNNQESADAKGTGTDVANGEDVLRQRNGPVVSNVTPYGGKGKAVPSSPSLVKTVAPSSDADLVVDVRAMDEEEGPKEFYHPASVEPQRVVWLPNDELGLAESELRELMDAGIEASVEHARMDGKGNVDVSGPPPGAVVREL